MSTDLNPPGPPEVTAPTPAARRALGLAAGVELTASWILVLLGAALRIRAYTADRALWHDEAAIALNIVGRPFADLVRPLDYDQGAPLGFLLLEKLITTLFGDGERALRFLPLAAGLASLPLFLALARRLLAPRYALLAIGLFALAGPSVEFSAEVKQYSSDLALALALMLLAPRLLAPESGPVRTLLLALPGAAALWFSHPALFVVAGQFSVAAVWRALGPGRVRALLSLVPAGLLLAASFGLVYLVSLRPLSQNGALRAYWDGYFLPLPPRSARDLLWYVRNGLYLFDDPVGLFLPGLAAFCLVVGLTATWRRDRAPWALLLAPLLLTLAASALRLYPARGRLVLFLAPTVLLLVALGVQTLGRQRELGRLVGPLLAGLLLLQPAFTSTFHALQPLSCESRYFGFNQLSAHQTYLNNRGCEAFRPALAALAERSQPGDRLWADSWSYVVLLYYRSRYGLDGLEAVRPVERFTDQRAFAQDLLRPAGARRAWYLFSPRPWTPDGSSEMTNEELGLLLLDRAGAQREAVRSGRVGLYLYDLSGAPPSGR